MTEIRDTQKTNKSMENINQDNLEKESKTFFSFIKNHKVTEINNYKTGIIKKFLSDENKHEIWNYISKEEMKKLLFIYQ